MAAFFRTRRSRWCSTTIRAATAWSLRSISGTRMGRAGDHLGGDEPPEGRPIFEPRCVPYPATAANPPHAAHHRRADQDAPRGKAARQSCLPSWPATVASPACTSSGCSPRLSIMRTTARTSTSARSGISRRREAGYRDTMETLEKAPWRASRSTSSKASSCTKPRAAQMVRDGRGGSRMNEPFDRGLARIGAARPHGRARFETRHSRA